MEKSRINKRGITLIALVVTIVVLLILAGVAINAISDNNGILGRANYSEFVSEYTALDESKKIYGYEKEIEKIDNSVYTIEDSIYPVTTDSVNISEISDSLKYCIIKYENIEEKDLTNTQLVDLKLVDSNKVQGKTKRSYAINTVNGNLYSIEGVNFNGKTYHIVGLGVNPNAQMTLPGDYEIIIDAGEGNIENWKALRIFYDKYIPNSLSYKVYTSEDKSEWTEHQIQSQGVTQNEENIEIIEPNITRYLKVEAHIKSVNGDNSEISNIMVNFYGYRKCSVIPNINTNGVSNIGNLYMISTPSNGEVTAQGTGTVTQTMTVPTNSGNYVLNGEIIGSPSTVVKVTSGNVTKEYTINNKSDLSGIKLEPGAQVEITSTLKAGDVIGKAEILVEDTTQLSQKESKADSYAGEYWKTKDEKTYMYNNGGTGYWKRCLLNGVNIDATGIINQGDNKRAKVTYQTSTDGKSWSSEFTNIQDAENIRYLKVRVQYQVFGDIEYGNTKSNILTVILNDGSYKLKFLDEDGTQMFLDRVYFSNSDESVQYTMPNSTIQKEGKVFAAWTYEDFVMRPGETCTIVGNTDFTAKYRVKLDILSQGKASFTITPNTQWQEKVAVTINNSLQDEDTTILQYKIGNDGTWETYEEAFEVNKNAKIYGRFYNTLTQETGYTFDDEITVIDSIDPSEATITLSASSVNAGGTITATVTHIDNETGIKTENCKYIINQSEQPIGKDGAAWNTATAFETNPQNITITEATRKIYYLHVLSVDKAGNKKETISSSIRFKGSFTFANFNVPHDYSSVFTGYRVDAAGLRGNGYLITKNTIDVTNLKTITFGGDYVGGEKSYGGDGWQPRLGVGRNNTDTDVDRYVNLTMSAANYSCNLNVEDLEGEYYIKITLFSYGSSLEGVKWTCGYRSYQKGAYIICVDK